MAWVATFEDPSKKTPEFMYDALALIAGSGLGLTVMEKVFLNDKKKDPENQAQEDLPTEFTEDPQTPHKKEKSKTASEELDDSPIG